MASVEGSTRIQELRRSLTLADASAFLVEQRVIRRVIRERFGFAQLSAAIPHTESQVVPAGDVRNLVHPDELGLTSFAKLPETCILISEPDEGELEHWPLQELMLRIWRRLFHAQVDRKLLELLHTSLHRADVQERISQIGQVEFDEAHFVLRSEARLVHPESRIEAWREFVALYLEMKHFEPDLLPVWFPSIAGQPQIDGMIGRDVDDMEILRRTQLYGASQPDLTSHLVRDETNLKNTRRDWSLGIGIAPSDRAYLRRLRRRERANERGNTVAAIVTAVRAVNVATSEDKRAAAREKARSDIRYLVDRLRRALAFADEDSAEWESSLWELATNSVHGFWNSEKKLLYDLQKVCLDHERVTYRVDLVKWIVSWGRRPLRRPLNSLREVMMANHLASAAARLAYVRLSGSERDRLTRLLHNAAHLAEEQMRQRMRPVVQQTLRSVQLTPSSVPEQVAFDKLTEDSLDCIADRGYLTMGYLRDAISKNDLKLPDLTELHELWRGDHLLRADDRLDVALDGVYRRGEFYLRWLQSTSSVFFGTRIGRFTTLFLFIPFGGGFVIVEGVRHVAHMAAETADADVTRESVGVSAEAGTRSADAVLQTQIETLGWVVVLGFLLMGLIHITEFRRLFFRILGKIWRAVRWLLIDLPHQLLNLPLVQQVWRNRTVIRFRRYVMTPGIVTVVGIKFLPWLLTGRELSWGWVVSVAALLSLALNSRPGRDAQELSAEWIGNTWHKLRARVVMAVIDWIIDVFRMVLNFIERFLYAVDEWLQFHSDESWLSIVAKAVLGVIWSFVSFLIRIYVNLLIEPTLHPVKHFPVVTVAHKIFLGFIRQISVWMFNLFKPYLGEYLAGTVTGFNVFFLPGIFGFVVWELKENWRLYQANRRNHLMPVPVGSHGETVARLLRPGFHSGTLPKLFRRLRRLEHQDASFRRFSARRAGREQLEHVERAIRNFVRRELIRLLELCPAWKQSGLCCGEIRAASNSFSVDLECSRLGETPVRLLFQEQSHWVAASVPETGWLRYASADQMRSFQNALEGFYRKAGIDLVREQLEINFIHEHPYDINSDGLAVWPHGQFDQELSVDLTRPGVVRAVPASEAAGAGISSAERDTVVFAESRTEWKVWEQLWTPVGSELPEQPLPPACNHLPECPVLHPIR